MSAPSSDPAAELAPRFLRSLSKTQPAQQVTSTGDAQRTSAAPESARQWMSRPTATAIEHFGSLSRRATRTAFADDDDADRSGSSSQPNANSVVADVSSQSPEPTVPGTFAKKIQDMLPTFPSFSPSISLASLGSPRTTLFASPPPETDHLPSLTPPGYENGPSEHSWQSVWSALDRFRAPHDKKLEPENTPGPSQDGILDCVDDNNSIMMYGPLEPDETSEVEIACSEIVSINGDGEEIRTPQSSFVPLPSESFDEVPVVGSPGRSPLARFLPLPFESIDQVLSSGGASPQPHSPPLPLDSINRMLSSGGRTPRPRFLRLPSESIDQVLTGSNGELSSVWRGDGESEAAGAVHAPPPTEPTGDRPPVKEYRVWLPSLTKISVQTMWWGFRIYLPPPVLDVLNNKQLEAVKRAAIITTALRWLMDNLPVALLPPQVRPGVTVLRHLVPYVGYMGGFIAWTWSAIRSFDKGHGVVLTATWLLPFVLIPGTWEADEMPTQPTPPASP